MTFPSRKNHPTTQPTTLWAICSPRTGLLLLLVATVLGTALRAADPSRSRSRRDDSSVASPLDRLKRRDAEHRWRNRVGQWSVPSPRFEADAAVPSDRNYTERTSTDTTSDSPSRLDRFGGWQESVSILGDSSTKSLLESHRTTNTESGAPIPPTSSPRISSRLEPGRLQQQVTQPAPQVRSLFDDELPAPVVARPVSLFDSELPSPLFGESVDSLETLEVPEPQPEIVRDDFLPTREPVREFRPFRSDVPTTLRTPDIAPILDSETERDSVSTSTPASLFNDEVVPSAIGLFDTAPLGKVTTSASAQPLLVSELKLTTEVEVDGGASADDTTEIAPRPTLSTSGTAKPLNPKSKNRTDFAPIPLAAIRPYYDYSPGNRPFCRPGQQGCPDLVPLPAVGTFERDFIALDYMWEPSNLFHNPLYFEDPELERYGHTSGQLLQPIASIGRFGLQLAGLPYQIAIEPVARDVSILGHHRPGEAIPARLGQIPWNLDAAIGAGLFYSGLTFIP